MAKKLEKKKEMSGKVRSYLEKSEQCDAKAQYSLARCYENGEGIEQDFNQALIWCDKAAKQGYKKAQEDFGRMYYNGLNQLNPNRPNAIANEDAKVAFVVNAAQLGYAPAQGNLAYWYDNDDQYVKKDIKKAVKYYKLAAEQGYAPAEYYLGLHYYKGDGVKQDKEKGIMLLIKAAEHDEYHALEFLYDVGIRYCKGDGVKQDKEKGIMLLTKIVELGYYQAEDFLEELKNK